MRHFLLGNQTSRRQQDMSVKAISLRRGQGVLYESGIWVVFSASHVAKGNKASYMQVELRSAKTGQIIARRFRVDENVEEAFFERKKMEYLYSEGQNLIMMDPTNYEQLEVPISLLGDKEVYLVSNMELEVSYAQGECIGVELPNTVELKILETPPGLKGATATNQLKEAVCEGGARIKIPAFVENGTVIKVDTRTNDYLGRA
jgi:elongation factor P